MKRLVFCLAALFLGATIWACEPEECQEFKDTICKTCGTSSEACKGVKKRRGRDEKKCKQGIAHVKARAKTEEGRKVLCTLLNDSK
jgi:hypothetical protein